MMARDRSKRRMPPALALKKVPPALAGFALTDAVDAGDMLMGSTAFNDSNVQPLDMSTGESVLDYADAIDTAGDVLNAIDVVDQAADAIDAADVLETVIDIFF